MSVVDVVDGARSRRRIAVRGSLLLTTSGSRPHAHYHNRFGYRQERVSSPRHRCGREDHPSEAASPQQVMKFFAALPPCLIGMEACATAHYWARELTKLGHEVRLMPAKDVKAYV